ncbi:uncharacterized protein LOC110608268 isoform X1 [Manihot esculenta]|uniref:uncharacterized protein LOC110608268 isoform X1 n=1 Tax=Manihot esculenta TaxID=3983 RepID=UPI001CC68B51|nr:uncharacterized protein LOC110608268 isoform X1 [Manihot esculenta]XP_043812191.1 uncharacterized protein LOC110608268 isoform X1 [Manihot esculenta]
MFKKLTKLINEEIKQETAPPTKFEDIEQMFKNKKSVTTISSMDLQSEIRQLKLEVRQLKLRCDYLEQNQHIQQNQSIAQNLGKDKTKVETDTEEEQPLKFNDITRIKYQKWYVKINLTIKDFTLETIAMLDSGADMNCIDQGIIPSKYFHKTKQTLSAANSTKVKIDYKIPSAHICNNGICFKTSFMLIKNLNTQIILGNPFLQMLYPFKVTQLGLETNVLGQDIIFQFITPINYHDINIFQQTNISKINNLKNQIKFLKSDLHSIKIEEQLEKPIIQQQLKEIQEKFEKDLCSELPTAFWDRKQHIVTLPYEPSFNEQNIPTKARPIQMNQEMVEFCKKEIQDLLTKKLIRPSKSPWSCAAFYVMKNAEIERGAPRLVINYKPLNTALQWIRYPIPNKQDLLNRLYKAQIFSKFDMKSGFWQIQIAEQDKYKTAFTVPFGQYEWNIMPFGLKNAPSEFQKIMNDIFNPYKFIITYIDDVLIFSENIDQHIKHVNVFYKAVKRNGLVLSKPKMKLFQTKIRFLGHEIYQNTIIPIQRSIEFANKFPDEIKDKNQLQRFLGSLNYIADFLPKLRILCKPLYNRLKKNPKPWTSNHTKIIQEIKKHVKTLPCLNICNPNIPKIVETDASDQGFGGILKQRINNKEHIIRYYSGVWNPTQEKYSTIKKEILAIVLCVTKFQGDLLNQKFTIQVDCKAAKDVLTKDVKNLAAKHIFARWQAF